MRRKRRDESDYAYLSEMAQDGNRAWLIVMLALAAALLLTRL